ncbi:hypothetical protein D9M68_534830 [compost metagenome]
MINNTLQIAAMTVIHAIAVQRRFTHSFYDIIGLIAIGKTIGHNEVDKIFIRYPLELTRIICSLPELVGYLSGFLSVDMHNDRKFSRLYVRRQYQIQKKIIGIFDRIHLLQGYPRIVDADRILRNIFSIYQQL